MTRFAATAVLLLTVSLLTMLVNVLLDQYASRKQLAQLTAALSPQVERYRKVEAQLDALASGTVALADNGDVVAGQVIQVLNKSGIRIRKAATTGTTQ